MSRRSHVIAAVAATGALWATGCGSEEQESTTASTGSSAATSASTAASATATAAAEPPRIAVVLTTYSDFQQAQEEGIASVVDPLGGSFKTSNANFDPQKLLANCRDAVSSGRFNAIILQVLDPPSGVPCTKVAHAAGIPVVGLDGTIGTDPDALEPQIEGVAGGVYNRPSDNADGRIELLRQACAGKDSCKVIGEIATPTDPMTNSALDAVDAASGIDVVAKVATGYDPGALTQKLPDVLTANPDVDVFLGISDGTAMAALPLLKQQGMLGKVQVIGDGGSRAGVKAVADGSLFASLGTWPRQEGALTAEMAVAAIAGQAVSPAGVAQRDVDAPELITKDSAADFTPEWGPER